MDSCFELTIRVIVARCAVRTGKSREAFALSSVIVSRRTQAPVLAGVWIAWSGWFEATIVSSVAIHASAGRFRNWEPDWGAQAPVLTWIRGARCCGSNLAVVAGETLAAVATCRCDREADRRTFSTVRAWIWAAWIRLLGCLLTLVARVPADTVTVLLSNREADQAACATILARIRVAVSNVNRLVAADVSFEVVDARARCFRDWEADWVADATVEARVRVAWIIWFYFTLVACVAVGTGTVCLWDWEADCEAAAAVEARVWLARIRRCWLNLALVT